MIQKLACNTLTRKCFLFDGMEWEGLFSSPPKYRPLTENLALPTVRGWRGTFPVEGVTNIVLDSHAVPLSLAPRTSFRDLLGMDEIAFIRGRP